MAFFEGDLLAELGRLRAIVKVESKCANHVYHCPFNLYHAKLTQELFLLEQLELWVLKRFEIGPLRLFAD